MQRKMDKTTNNLFLCGLILITDKSLRHSICLREPSSGGDLFHTTPPASLPLPLPSPPPPSPPPPPRYHTIEENE
ncbi:hypothetical protein E2C01_102721 [Portunus trituberculatus]|uniref:Uncharacterized protein n=1 Tax=Portunus trituberculatus TaxID=210409 RepID=A0A5B7KNG3_PORTR|nr:hypothetical protein [Portunus trituberculatus]